MEQQIQVIQQADVLAAINSSEIDSQVATAHRFPRDVEQALSAGALAVSSSARALWRMGL